MKKGLNVKVTKIIPDKVPKDREILESYLGLSGIVESSHVTLNGTINYVKFNSVAVLSQPFYSRELVKI